MAHWRCRCRRTAAAVVVTAAFLTPSEVAVPALAQTDAALAAAATLWYRQPAAQWDHAMPIGNGRLGGMVFGSVRRERVQLNEDSLWMGGPRETNNPDALAALPEVRRLLFAGRPVEAYAVAERRSMGRPFRLESYQTLGDLRLMFEQEGAVSDYRRELDLDSAIVRVRYRIGDVRYTREFFSSAVDQVLVVRLSADRPAQMSFSVWMDRLQDATTVVVGSDRLDLVGHLAGGKGLSFQSSLRVIPDGGTIEAFPERLAVENAQAATLVLAAKTSYRGGDPRTTCDRQLAAATARSYDQLR
ncbi:MAG: glycoside hydrolase family 95 protein, partial [Acidobacteria bacterium]|nr:glycoside hydrolase family 95 protein [Acidobacteriota bacterium]